MTSIGPFLKRKQMFWKWIFCWNSTQSLLSGDAEFKPRGRFHKRFCALRSTCMPCAQLLRSFLLEQKFTTRARKFGVGRKTVYEIDPERNCKFRTLWKILAGNFEEEALNFLKIWMSLSSADAQEWKVSMQSLQLQDPSGGSLIFGTMQYMW